MKSIEIRTYDRTLLRQPCTCNPADDVCHRPGSGHHTYCKRHKAYCRAMEQAVLWRRLAGLIADESLAERMERIKGR